MRVTYAETYHINTFSRVLSELSSQGINFKEEVKAPTGPTFDLVVELRGVLHDFRQLSKAKSGRQNQTSPH